MCIEKIGTMSSKFIDYWNQAWTTPHPCLVLNGSE